MPLGESFLLGLDAVGRRILPFGSAPDIRSDEVEQERFGGQLDRSELFDDGFRIPLELEGRVVLEVGAGFGALQLELLRRGAAKAIALDVDAHLLERVRVRTGGDPRVELVHAPIERCPLADESVDVVVSDATFEHLTDVPAALREIRRILRPGGFLFTRWGPTWFHFNGPHLITYVHVPWVHLLFSNRTIRAVLERYRRERRYTQASIEARIDDLERMNRLSVRGFKAAFEGSGLEVLQFDNVSPRRWKQFLCRLPIFGELLAGSLIAVLYKKGP